MMNLAVRDHTDSAPVPFVPLGKLAGSACPSCLQADAFDIQAVYMLDPEGWIVGRNAGAQPGNAFADDGVVGAHFSCLYTEAEREAGVPTRHLDLAAREGRCEREGWRVRGGGRRIWAHTLISAMRDRGGSLIGFAKVTRDVTRQREMLLQAHRMEAVGHLTAGLVHDFNNLLAVLLASLHRLRPSVKDEGNATALLDTAVQVAQRGAALTRRMLAFARRREQVAEPVDVPAVVSNLLPMLRQAAGPSVRVEARFPSPLAPALADPSLLELALLNLVVNARDAMPDGGSVVIAAREDQAGEWDAAGMAPGRCVCLTVADEGQGMDEATLARVMEPLFTTKAEGKGTGLGLPMIRDFAEQSGGRLDLRSRPGEGTTAEIRLPIPAGERARQGRGRRETASAPLSVLVVEDNPLILMDMVGMLADLGHRVLEASSGGQALDTLREYGADLVLTDEEMPGMTGTRLRAEIRKAWPGLPVVLASGHDGDIAEVQDGPRLRKPFDREELARVIDHVRPPA